MICFVSDHRLFIYIFYFAYLFSSELDQGNSSDNEGKKAEEEEYVNQIPCFFIPPPRI